MLYFNYDADAIENRKNSSRIINYLTNNIPTMSHYSWTKESRTLDKKLNGKKSSEIKKRNLTGKEMSSNLQKLKNNYLQGE